MSPFACGEAHKLSHDGEPSELNMLVRGELAVKWNCVRQCEEGNGRNAHPVDVDANSGSWSGKVGEAAE
jgi:hypothetical protein